MRMAVFTDVLAAIDGFYDPLIARGASRIVSREAALAEAA